MSFIKKIYAFFLILNNFYLLLYFKNNQKILKIKKLPINQLNKKLRINNKKGEYSQLVIKINSLKLLKNNHINLR